MTQFTSLHLLNPAASWLTIGIFDGVHLGHRSLLQHLVTGARQSDARSVVLTFHPHPAIILGKNKDFQLLTTPQERAALLEEAGVDIVITQPFDLAFADQTASAFMEHLAPALGLQHLILGYDSALGRGRAGSAEQLGLLGTTLGYTLETIPPLRQGSEIISSRAIRHNLQQGALDLATAALGHPYSLAGPVVHGDGRGRHINVPTANLAIPPQKLIPANGIYATWAWVAGQRYPSATNIGTNPTFKAASQPATIEAHLIDFHQDLYGQEVRLEFIARLRDEIKFDSVEALLAQIQADIAQSRAILH